MAEQTRSVNWTGALDAVETIFTRGVALVLLVFAISYWMRLTGFHGGPDYRFDTMSEHWRIASASLAVFFPVAALGLWGRFSWGMVVWFLAAAQEVAMHTWFSDLFGRAYLIVAFHLITLLVFLGLEVARRVAARG